MTRLAALIAALAIPALALATPPQLRMDSTGAIQAKAVGAIDGGFHAAGLSEIPSLTGFNVPALAPPAPTITTVYLDGGTTWTYAVTACSSATCAAGTESALGSSASTTLDYAAGPTATKTNTVTIPAVVGAAAFGVWQVAPTGAGMGLIAVVPQVACGPAGGYCGAVFVDQGRTLNPLIADLTPNLPGYGDAGPTIDLSAAIQTGALVVGGTPAGSNDLVNLCQGTCTPSSATTCTFACSGCTSASNCIVSATTVTGSALEPAAVCSSGTVTVTAASGSSRFNGFCSN